MLKRFRKRKEEREKLLSKIEELEFRLEEVERFMESAKYITNTHNKETERKKRWLQGYPDETKGRKET